MRLLKNNNIFNGAILALLGRVYSLALNYLSLIVVARLLTPDDFGAYTFAISIITFAYIIANLAAENTVIYLLNKVDNTYSFLKFVIKKVSIASLFSYMLVICIGLVYNFSTGWREVLIAIIYIGISIIFHALIIIYRVVNQYESNYLKFVLPEKVIRPTLFLLTLIAMITFDAGNGLYLISMCYTLSFILTFIIVLSWNNKYVIHTLKSKKTKYSNFLKIAMQNTTINVLNHSTPIIIMLLVGFFITRAEVGVFRAAEQSALLVSFCLLAINQILLPKYSLYATEKNFDELNKIYQNATMIILHVSTLISLTMVVLSTFILQLFGGEYASYSWVLCFLIWGQLINASTGSSGFIMIMTGNQEKFIKILITQLFVVSTIMISFFTWFTPSLFIPVTGYVLGQLLTSLLPVIFLYKNYRLSPYKSFKELIVSFILIISLTLLILNDQEVLSVILLIVYICYIAFLYRNDLRRLKQNEIRGEIYEEK